MVAALLPPAQSVVSGAIETIYGFTFLLAVFGAAGLGLAALWLPFLLSGRVRELFEVGPTGHWAANYALGFVALATVHVSALFVTLTNAPTDDAVASIVVFTGPAIALACWATAAFALPFAGYEWLEDAVATRLLLFAGAVWYAAVTTVPLFIAMVFYYFPG
ncbi:hypothetical protein ACFQMA_13450 [Halosimplex aquaticum]|uniref:DUF8162 domain-containing protein n=1 Tax=Halosimplex aquaticum TaxID=3026162 RepID=A0ABD5Y0A8_9EURY|nr:hypothetical protein [Halosimplex aquaticum]